MPGLTALINPGAEAGRLVRLMGYRTYFALGIAAAGRKAFHLGHTRSPAPTLNRTEKDVETTINGAVELLKTFNTKIVEEIAFETATSGDLDIRALHSGGPVLRAVAQMGATPFAPTTAYALNDLVYPTVPNGLVYKVTTAGTTGASEPTWGLVIGGTTTSGTGGTQVTFTAQAVTGYDLIIERRKYAYGTLIEVNLNGEDSSLPCEIHVMPNVALTGDGKGGGFDGQNETSLKFKGKVLTPGDYALPASVGNLGNERVTGGILIPEVPADKWEEVVQAIITGT